MQREFRREDRHHRRRLGQAIALLHQYAARLVDFQHRQRTRRAADDEHADRGEIGLGEGRVMRHEQEHRGHAEHRGDAVRRDFGERATRVERAMQHDEPALLKGDERGHVEPADVKDRRRGQRDVVLQNIHGVHRVGVVPPEIAMRQHRALGTARRARGVHDHCDIVVVDRDLRSGGRIARPARLVLRRKQRPQIGQLIPQRSDRWRVMRIDDQRGGATVLDHEREFRPGQAKIERHEDRPQPRCREHREQEHRLVEAEKGDAVAFRHAPRAQPRRAIRDGLLHLAVGPCAPLEMQRLAFGRPRRAQGEPVRKADIRFHADLPVPNVGASPPCARLARRNAGRAASRSK